MHPPFSKKLVTTMSGRRHPASLVPICLHNPQLVQLMAQRPDLAMVRYIARRASDIIQIDDEPSSELLIPLENFIARLVQSTNLLVSTLLATLIYLERLRYKLPPMSKAFPYSRHYVFLGILIIAAKYLNDASPRTIHWAHYARLFSVPDLNLMERELLYLLGYDLRFDEAEACSVFAPLLSSISRLQQYPVTRASAIDKVTKAGRARVQTQRANYQAAIPSRPPPALSAQLSVTSRASNTVSLAVRGIVKRLSTTHLASNHGPTCAMQATLSNGSTSSSSSTSDMASLLEDTGSSSSSSGWTSNDSSSDFFEDESGNGGILRAGPVDEDAADTTITMAESQALSLSMASIDTKHPFRLRPASAYKNVHRRGRKASDTSSIRTVIASPTLPTVATSSSTSFLFPSRESSARQQSLRRNPRRIPSLSATPDSSSRAGITQSSTEPSISHSVGATLSTSSTGNFLSRMWVAATTAKAQSIEQQPQAPGALRRLVLAHSRSSVFNGGRPSHSVEV